MLNSALLGTVLWGPDLRLLYNDAYAPALAERHPDALGQSIAEVWDGGVWDQLGPNFRRVLETGEAIFETRYPLPMVRDGRTVLTHWNYSVSPIRDGAGRIVGLLNQALEITGEVESEERLRASEGELRSVADALPPLVGFADRTLTYRFANAAYRDWFDRSPDEVIGRTIPEITGEALYAVRRTGIERALAGEKVRFDLDWPWPDGRRRVADIRYTPRWDPDGAVDGFYIFVQDVTVLRDAAALLTRRKDALTEEVIERGAELRLYRDIVESDASSILAFDRDHRVTGFNGAHAADFLRVMGHRQAVGEVLPDLFTSEQAAALRGLMDRALAGERFVVVQAFGDPDRGLPTWEITYTPLRNGAGRIIGAFHHARDVSERERAATELRSVQDQLVQAQKMEAVGQLTGGLAHDFNNLLAGISGSLEMMGTRINQGRIKDIEKYMMAAQGASRRAAALTHRLLAFSRRQTLAPRPTNVNALVGGMLDLIQRTVGPSVEVQNVGAAGLWPALVDALQLENALLNNGQLEPGMAVLTKPFAVDTLAARIGEMIVGTAGWTNRP